MINPEQAPPQPIEEFEHINDVEVDPSAEKLSRGIKVVVGGPPHSGKSVFINALSENLQHDVHYFSACPDGEGMWLQRHYDDPDVKALRRKGSFTDEFVDWAAEGVKNWDGPLMVVDIGGITSPENSKIVEGATHGIILAGNLGKAAEWQDFFRESGIEEVATLHSHYHGTSDVQIDSGQDRVVGSVHYLERGVDVTDRATIEAVASKIDELVDSNKAYKTAHNEQEPQHYDMVDINELAYAVGAAETLKTRPDGTEVIDLEVGPEQLEAVYQVLTGTPLQKEVWVDGPSRSHLITTIFTALHDAGVETMKYNSPNGFIDIAPLEQEGEGSGNVEWEVVKIGDVNGKPSYYVEAKLDPSIPFKPEEMPNVRIPEMPEDATVVISGKIPHWLRASIALGYKDNTAAVAAFIPGDGAFVAWSVDKQVLPLGTSLET